MKTAVIKLSAVSGTVTNIIVADGTIDFPPDKTSILVNIPEDHQASDGWNWHSADGFTTLKNSKTLPNLEDSPLKIDIIADTVSASSDVAIVTEP